MSDPIVPTPDADALLAQADALHDDEPPRALELLRTLDVAALSAARLGRMSFLDGDLQLIVWQLRRARRTEVGPTLPRTVARRVERWFASLPRPATHHRDIAWPVLRNYPYGPATD